jgi:hypothetical protein
MGFSITICGRACADAGFAPVDGAIPKEPPARLSTRAPLAMSESNTAVSAATGLSRFALSRHRKHMSAAIAAAYSVAPPEEREKALVSYGSDLQAEVRALIDEANSLRATAVRKRDIRTALKGIDTALKALEMFAKLSGQLQGPQHNHLHLHAEVPSREEAIEVARECLEVFAPHLLAAQAVTVDGPVLVEEEPAGVLPKVRINE